LSGRYEVRRMHLMPCARLVVSMTNTQIWGTALLYATLAACVP
jgi:hypothetical protein